MAFLKDFLWLLILLKPCLLTISLLSVNSDWILEKYLSKLLFFRLNSSTI